MNLQGLFREINPSKCLLYTSLLIFVVLFGLRLDSIIHWNYFYVFMPLWLWKTCVIAGAAAGATSWLRHPEYRGANNVDLQAMFVATSFHILLLLFELMVCTNMEFHNLPYRVIFIPMYGISVLSIAACIWGYRHERQLELESFFSLNILQFICLSLKFDSVVEWDWMVVFVPVWIVLTLLSIGVIYYVIWVLLFLRSSDVTGTQRRERLFNAVMFSFTVVPLIAFFVMLTRRLDGFTKTYYTTVFAPLDMSLISLVVTSFYQKGANQWWFGMRKDFCEFLLDSFPCLREYGNVTYRCPDVRDGEDTSTDADAEDTSDISMVRTCELQKRNQATKLVGTVLTIDMPD